MTLADWFIVSGFVAIWWLLWRLLGEVRLLSNRVGKIELYFFNFDISAKKRIDESA